MSRHYATAEEAHEDEGHEDLRYRLWLARGIGATNLSKIQAEYDSYAEEISDCPLCPKD